MSPPIKPLISTEIVAYSGRSSREKVASSAAELEMTFSMHRSMQLHKFACQHFHSIPLSVRVRIGNFPPPEKGEELPRPFQGTMRVLADTIDRTVRASLKSCYNGLVPYLKLLDYLDQKKSFYEMHFDSANEEQTGTTCVGWSHSILQNLKEKHEIEGALSIRRTVKEQRVEHEAVIVECSDGYVWIEPAPSEKEQMHFLPFGKTLNFGRDRVVVSSKGSAVPFTLQDTARGVEHEFCVGVGNSDDLTLKTFVTRTDHELCVAVCFHNWDGSLRKFIMIFPYQAKVVFKNEMTDKDNRTHQIAFEQIDKGELLPMLEKFMEPNFVLLDPNFPFSAHFLNAQMIRFISNWERIKQFHSETDFSR